MKESTTKLSKRSLKGLKYFELGLSGKVCPLSMKSLFLSGKVTISQDSHGQDDCTYPENGCTYILLGMLKDEEGVLVLEQPDVYIHEDLRLEEWTVEVPILEIGPADGFLNKKYYLDSDLGTRTWTPVELEDYILAFNVREDEDHQLEQFISGGYYYAVVQPEGDEEEDSSESSLLKTPA